MASSGARQSHVSSLSGKIQGLKFMQRAAASNKGAAPASSSTSSAAAKATSSNDAAPVPSPSSSRAKSGATGRNAGPSVTQEQHSPAPSEPIADDGNEEHWVLPGKAAQRQAANNTAVESEELGWNAFLSQASASVDGENEKGGDPSSGSARRKFGSWGDKRKREKRQADDDEPDFGMSDDEDGALDYASDGHEGEDGKGKKKGFIKPGTMGKRQRREHNDDEVLQSGARGAHAKARDEAAKKKRADMSSEEKAKMRRKHGFYVPDPGADSGDDSDGPGDDSISVFDGAKTTDTPPRSISSNSNSSKPGNQKIKKAKAKKR